MKTRFWLSWVQPGDDHRPLTYPPNEAVLGWWCSGYTAADQACICALVSADDAEKAMEAIWLDWPEAKTAEWRFIQPQDAGFVPGDRFPPSEWMKQRMTGESS